METFLNNMIVAGDLKKVSKKKHKCSWHDCNYHLKNQKCIENGYMVLSRGAASQNSILLLFHKLTLTKCGLSTVVYGRLGVYFMYVITNIWHSQPCMKWNHIYIYFFTSLQVALLLCKDPRRRDWFFCESHLRRIELALCSTEFFMFIWEKNKKIRISPSFHNLLRQQLQTLRSGSVDGS